MIHKVSNYRTLVRQYGVKRCLQRLAHDVQRKTGLLKRKFPPLNWQDRPLGYWLTNRAPGDAASYKKYRRQSPSRFFFAPGSPPDVPPQWRTRAIEEANGVPEGRFRYFSSLEANLGCPQCDWLLNPFTGVRESASRHWCDHDDFEASRGDIKYFWEPSRFCWAYALARAYASVGDEKYPRAFWEHFESWMQANPPQIGINWQCGQEIAIRIMSCTFALYAFWSSRHTTAERVAMMTTFLAASAQRIAGNINYARAQMGNHAVSEAAGIYTTGVLFGELKDARHWRELGRHVLEDEAIRFNWPDGSYTQHSMNYQRLMLHDYLWAVRLGELNGEEFAPHVTDSLAGSWEFMFQLQDDITGRTPNYGPNDGALILPLNDCSYLDYRPVIGAVHYLTRRSRLYEPGPWDEDLLWLFGPEALKADIHRHKRRSSDFDYGGYYTLRGGDSWAMLRCHSYKNRPNQADMLHLDLWWRGINLLRDSGSFSYFDPAGLWNRYFVSTAAHNTVVLGGEDQMIKGPRFRWFTLIKSKFQRHLEQGDCEIWQGEHYGYRRLDSRATHRRTVARIGQYHWLVVDDILGSGDESVELLWQLADVTYSMQGSSVVLETGGDIAQLTVGGDTDKAESAIHRGVEKPIRSGWQSLYYGRREAAPTFSMAFTDKLPRRLITLLNLGGTCEITEFSPESVVAWSDASGRHGEVKLFPVNRDDKVIRSIRIEGMDEWRIDYNSGK